MSLIKQQKSRILHSFSRVVGALSPWFTFATNMGVDLVLLQVWFDGPLALVAPVAVRVRCVFPCQFSMFSTFKFVFCKRKIIKK